MARYETNDKRPVEKIPREDLKMDEEKDIIGEGATAGTKIFATHKKTPF